MIPIAIYDVFSGEAAAGNPCGVVELDCWLSDSELQQITADAGLPVISFITKVRSQFHLRWFTSGGEINLCGHGSLGAGAAILAKYHLDRVMFSSKHGEVEIAKSKDRYSLLLPAWAAKPCQLPAEISALAADAIDVFSTRDIVVVLPSVEKVMNFQPDDYRLQEIRGYHALILTAANGRDGYVLRYFAPKIGIPEDLATGSAQCSLAPYWFHKLGLDWLNVRQLSRSGGYFEVERTAGHAIKVFAQAKQRAVAV